MLIEEELTGTVISAAIEVHRALGPGLLESAYEVCLSRELELRGIGYRRQVPVPIEYKGFRLDCGYKVDILVEGSVVLELKSVESLQAIHEAQLLTYLRLTRCEVGLLINFNSTILKNGIVRRALSQTQDSSPRPPRLRGKSL